MTANEDELTQQIASILDKPSVYMGGPSHRSLRLAGEIVDLLRSTRASIRPDSERIRELEAEVERLRGNWSDLAARCDRAQTELSRPLAQPDVSRLDKAQGVALVRDYMRSYR